MAQTAERGHRILLHCSDGSCCENCVEYKAVAIFDEPCLWDDVFEMWESEKCSSTRRGYVYHRGHWDNARCQGQPIYSVRTGECYPDYQSGGSYFFNCDLIPSLKSNKGMTSNQEDSNYYIVGGVIVTFVFLIGALLGYRFYKRRKLYAQDRL